MKLPLFLRNLTGNSTPDTSTFAPIGGGGGAVRAVPCPPVPSRASNPKPSRPRSFTPPFRRSLSYLSNQSAHTCSTADSWPDAPGAYRGSSPSRVAFGPPPPPLPPTTTTTTSSSRPKLPPFFRTTSYRSDKSFRSCASSRNSSKSPDVEYDDTPVLVGENLEYFLPRLDQDSAIYTPVSPTIMDSEDEGLAFQDLDSSSLRVIVIGTGFAGLSTAIACARQGFAVTVLERSSGRSAHGDSILLGSNATVLLHRWGVGEEMWRRSSQGDSWIMYNQEGREVHREDLIELSNRYGAPILQGKRSHFIGAMGTEARLLGVKFRYEAEVTGYADSADAPAVILRGGEIVRGDAVVVCDGARSISRTLLSTTDESVPPRRPSGYSIYRSIVGGEAFREDPVTRHLLDGNIRFWLGVDSHVEIWPMDDGKQIAFTFTRPDKEKTSSLSWRAVTPISTCLAELSDWDPVLQAAICKFPKALNWTILEDAHMSPGWISKGGKIVFAGDAVHPISPASFQGATQAVEDGATIAMCLGLAGGVPERVATALRAFELLRRGRPERAAQLGRKQQRIFHTFTSRTRDDARPLDKNAPRRLSFSPGAEVLRPLAFEMFNFDAEQYVRDNFAKVVTFIERQRRGSIVPVEEMFPSQDSGDSD